MIGLLGGLISPFVLTLGGAAEKGGGDEKSHSHRCARARGRAGRLRRPSPPARAFPLPARPTAGAAPSRPAVHPGDVIPGNLEGEGRARVCFRPGKWREILSYLIDLEVRARTDSLCLTSHIEKLEKQIGEMNRFIEGRN